MGDTELPSISHPNEFINDDVGIGEIARLDAPPTIGHFTWLSHYPEENGLFFYAGNWYVMSGEYRSFPIMSVPQGAKTIIHIHNGYFVEPFFYYPTIFDYLHSPNFDARHFVVSQLGVIRYWPVEVNQQQYIRLRSLGSNPLYRDEIYYYLQVLEDNALRWKAHVWSEIPDDDVLLSILALTKVDPDEGES